MSRTAQPGTPRPMLAWLRRQGAATRAELRGWGWPAATGTALLLASAALAWGATPALQRADANAVEEIDLWQQRATARRARSATGGTAVTMPGTGAAFRHAFPGAVSRSQRVAALVATAHKRGLMLQSMDLRLQPEPALGLARYRIQMPLQGSYAAVRGLVADSLRQDPALALDALQLQRDEDAAGGLRVELRWSLYSLPDLGVP